MGWQGWFTLGLLAVMLFGLIRFAHLADVVFLGGLTVLGLMGIITPSQALKGFSNPAMLTVAALFVVAAGLRDSGALDGIARRLLGQPTTERRMLLRLLAPIGALSALLNNTTIVAMTMPVVLDWCRKHRLSASRFLMPLSHITVAGGIITLIGTSTNLVVHGLMLESDQLGHKGMGFLEIGIVGAPLTIVVLLYLAFVAPRLLPQRQELLEQLGASKREFMVEMIVDPSCPLLGQTVQDAGLRQLPGLFLAEIERNSGLVSPVGPEERLESGDRLVFVGVVSTIVDLQKIKGLRPAAEDIAADRMQDRARHLCEAVISASSPLVGRSVKAANFRTVYDAAVIAVHRNGERLKGKIGSIVLRPGDTLLLHTSTGFQRAHRNNPDFYLISEIGGSEPVRHEKAKLSIAILSCMVLLMALPDILEWCGAGHALKQQLDQGRIFFALSAAGLMVICRCVSSATARRNIQWEVLFVIAASFGISEAMEKTGAASFIASAFVPAAKSLGPVFVLAAVYVSANILTEFLTNNAAAALMFPIAMAAAHELPGADPRPYALAVAIAASAAFSTPIGYQTNLMIFGPGGYKFTDFVRVGLPLNLICAVISVTILALAYGV